MRFTCAMWSILFLLFSSCSFFERVIDGPFIVSEAQKFSCTKSELDSFKDLIISELGAFGDREKTYDYFLEVSKQIHQKCGARNPVGYLACTQLPADFSEFIIEEAIDSNTAKTELQVEPEYKQRAIKNFIHRNRGEIKMAIELSSHNPSEARNYIKFITSDSATLKELLLDVGLSKSFADSYIERIEIDSNVGQNPKSSDPYVELFEKFDTLNPISKSNKQTTVKSNPTISTRYTVAGPVYGMGITSQRTYNLDSDKNTYISFLEDEAVLNQSIDCLKQTLPASELVLASASNGVDISTTVEDNKVIKEVKFGQRVVQSESTVNFTYLNTGNVDVTGFFIQQASSNAQHFLLTTNCESIIPALSECDVKIEYSPLTNVSHENQIVIGDDNPNNNFVLNLSGRGVPINQNLNSNTTSVNFGTIVSENCGVTYCARKTIRLENYGNVHARELKVTSDSSYFNVKNNCPSILQAGSTCEIDIEFKSVIDGSFGGVISVTAKDFTGDNFSPIRIQTQAVRVPPRREWNLSYSSYNFGGYYLSQCVFECAEMKFRIYNNGNIKTGTVNFSSLTHFDVSHNCPYSGIEPGQSCEVTVDFDPWPKNPGSYSEVLRVTSYGWNTLELSLSGTVYSDSKK